MLDGIEILIARMQTNPEEFVEGVNSFTRNKWFKLIDVYEDCIPQEDLDAFYKAVESIRRQGFNKCVMEILMDSEDDVLFLTQQNKSSTP